MFRCYEITFIRNSTKERAARVAVVEDKRIFKCSVVFSSCPASFVFLTTRTGCLMSFELAKLFDNWRGIRNEMLKILKEKKIYE